MINVVTLVESQETRLEISSRDAEALTLLGRRLASQEKWWGDDDDDDGGSTSSVISCRRTPAGEWMVLVREAVGVIGVGSLEIEVRPKIPNGHFMYLARKSNLLPRTDEIATSVAWSGDLWKLVVQWFVQATERLLRRELARGYTETTDELNRLRGQIEPLRSGQAFYRGNPSFWCRYEEFNEDTPLNRVVRAAAELVVAARYVPPDLRRRARRILARMGDVGAVQASDLRVNVERATHYYQKPLAFAKYLLRRVGVHIRHGDNAAWAFLIRTPELIEAGVRAVLRERLAPEWKVAKRQIKLEKSALVLNPDLVFGDLAVGDVKYKVAGADWARQDLYQVTAFATAFRCSTGALIAYHAAPSDPQVRFAMMGDSTMAMLLWDAREQVAPEEAAVRLTSHVASWLATARSLDAARNDALLVQS